MSSKQLDNGSQELTGMKTSAKCLNKNQGHRSQAADQCNNFHQTPEIFGRKNFQMCKHLAEWISAPKPSTLASCVPFVQAPMWSPCTRGPKEHVDIRSYKPWFLEFQFLWVLQPECGILMSIQSSGRLGTAASYRSAGVTMLLHIFSALAVQI